MRIRGRWRVNISLFMVVLVLGALAVIRPGKKDEAVKSPLLAIDNASLKTLTLQNGEHIEFERKDGSWRMVQPFAAAVNQARIDQLLAIASINPAAEYPLPEPRLREGYGLSEPFAKLNLAGADLEFGGTAPLDHRRYVRNGEKLYLLDDNFSHQLTSKATDFVDKKLIPEDASIRDLILPGLRISKSGEGTWTSIPPLPTEQLQDLIMQWSTSRAIEVRRGAPKVLGERIELQTSTGPIRFSIFQKKPELILGREDLDLVFVMTAETGRSLLNQPAAVPSQDLTKLPSLPQHGEEGARDDDHQGLHADE
ncbi:MAG: hypothetical protein RLZ25_1123 [Pseudomonadota bacterium]